ncbi:DUF2079 domain-containing protein [Cytophaga aurantiaca]|uniref:DUF2079 domain-containing protein n=1 Tax=Cytophaga aurantiaca TaxID=29530 RepID=UPI000372E380|nr:DUF2079 domain-containing protein [Cytophaga aurantiaca]
MNKSNSFKILVAIILFFAIVYSSISLVNHYCFRTYALDLGMFNQAIYSFSHFKMNYFTLDISGAEINYFGDHFSPITILLSPFYYIFGSYTLLIIQIAAILFGGYGIYKYASLSHPNSYLPLLLTVHFFSIWGIYSALSYDFHTNVLAAMFIPWLVYFYEKENKKYFLIVFVLILLAKENMALWLAFIVAGLVLKNILEKGTSFPFKKILSFEIPLILISFVYFVVIVAIVMPLISHGEGTNQIARYGHLGNSFSEIILSILKNPKYIFSLFFESTSTDPITTGIKSELHFMVLISGGFALLYRPYYLVMLIPIYAQKLLTTDYGFWGINNQYSIEFVPILTLCLSDLLLKIKPIKLIYAITLATVFLTAAYTIQTIRTRKSIWYENTNSIFFEKKHYQTEFNRSEILKALHSIPQDASVSASPAITPHIASRDSLYHFPVVKNASYIALFTEHSSVYPLNQEEFISKIQEYKTGGKYDVIYDKNFLLILKRK